MTASNHNDPSLSRRGFLGAGAAAASATALVGLSRVYLDLHYLSDVTSGWAVGAFWFALFAAIALVTVRLRKT